MNPNAIRITKISCIMTLSAFIAATAMVDNSIAKGIDWEGAALDPPSKQQSQRPQARKSNLPGVGTFKRKNSNRARCQNTRIFTDAEQAECNRKTPLLILRNGRLGGVFTEFPR